MALTLGLALGWLACWQVSSPAPNPPIAIYFSEIISRNDLHSVTVCLQRGTGLHFIAVSEESVDPLASCIAVPVGGDLFKIKLFGSQITIMKHLGGYCISESEVRKNGHSVNLNKAFVIKGERHFPFLTAMNGHALQKIGIFR